MPSLFMKVALALALAHSSACGFVRSELTYILRFQVDGDLVETSATEHIVVGLVQSINPAFSNICGAGPCSGISMVICHSRGADTRPDGFYIRRVNVINSTAELGAFEPADGDYSARFEFNTLDCSESVDVRAEWGRLRGISTCDELEAADLEVVGGLRVEEPLASALVEVSPGDGRCSSELGETVVGTLGGTSTSPPVVVVTLP